MSKIYQYNSSPSFIFYSNYKIMSSILEKMLLKSFPGIKIHMSLNTIESPESYTKITIVRNPFDRLLSLYFDKCVYQPKRIKNKQSKAILQKNQKHILNAYSYIIKSNFPIVDPGIEISETNNDYNNILRNLYLLESIDFRTFIQIVEHLFDNNQLDAHFLPQSSILTVNNNLILDHFFKLENIKSEWQKICKLLQKQIPLQQGKNRTNFEGVNKYHNYYSVRMKQTVYFLYKSDFKNFDYAF